MARADDLVSGHQCQRLHGRLWEDRSGVCARTSGSLEYRVNAEIDTETPVGIVARSRSVLVFFHLLGGRFVLSGYLAVAHRAHAPYLATLPEATCKRSRACENETFASA